MQDEVTGIRKFEIAGADGLPTTIVPDNAAEIGALDGDGPNDADRPRIDQAANLHHFVSRAANQYLELNLGYVSSGGVEVAPFTEDACAVTG
jgi:hypothetical protein